MEIARLQKEEACGSIYGQMISDVTSLLRWAKRAGAQPQRRTVLDLEADSLHRYRERLCLIQYADAEGVEIIDPLAIKDMGPFCDWLRGAEVWMHGADYDMRLLRQAYGMLPVMILDTQIAARLLGHEQFGLAALVEHFYGIKLSKKNQKANWGVRPIPEAMQAYAQEDVAYMLDMAERMVAQLRAMGRYEWFLESCAVSLERGRQRHVADEKEAWRIRGCGRLNRRGLAALRALWRWREAEAARLDRPVFMVCSNQDLLWRCAQLQDFRRPAPPSGNSGRISRYRRAVRSFQLMDEEEYPLLPRRAVPPQTPRGFEKQLERWLARRDALAVALHLDASLIASRAQAEMLAADEGAGLEALMCWQRELLTDHETAQRAISLTCQS